LIRANKEYSVDWDIPAEAIVNIEHGTMPTDNLSTSDTATLVTYSNEEGPTGLKNTPEQGYTTLTVAAVDPQQRRPFNLILRGTLWHPLCGAHEINSTFRCLDPDRDIHWNIAYHAEDNLGMPKGNYIAVLD